jgi:hypothetical protein
VAGGERLFKTAVLRSSPTDQVDCGMRSILSARLPKQKETRKQDQIGILAQNILLCGKLRAGIFPRMIIQYPREEFVK